MVRGMLILVMLGLVGCGHPTSRSPRDVTASGAESIHSTEKAGDMTQPAVGDRRPDTSSGRVEVLSFHTRRRCPTCRAIEQLTREVVSKTFARQVADSLLVLRVVEIDAESELSERYRVAWSSLLLQGAIRWSTSRAGPSIRPANAPRSSVRPSDMKSKNCSHDSRWKPCNKFSTGRPCPS